MRHFSHTDEIIYIMKHTFIHIELNDGIALLRSDMFFTYREYWDMFFWDHNLAIIYVKYKILYFLFEFSTKKKSYILATLISKIN